MSKMKVIELAKELEKPSKDILKLLEKMNVQVADKTSEITDAEAARVRDFYERRKKREAAGEAPERKKKKIVQVLNPQNSRMSGGPDKRLKERDERQKEEARAKAAAEAAKKAAEAAAKKAAEEAAKAEAARVAAAKKAAEEAEKRAAEEAARKAAEAKAKAEAEAKAAAEAQAKAAEAEAKAIAAKKAAEKATAEAAKAVEEPKKTEKTEKPERREGQRREGDNRQRREGQGRDGENRQRREGDNRQRRDGQGRDGENRQRREGDNRQRREGGFQSKDGDNRQRREGGFQGKDGDNRQRREGGFQSKDGDNRGRRDGGFMNKDKDGDNRGRRDGQGFQGRGGQGARGGRDRGAMLEQPTEAIERQNQKNKRSEQRNEKKNYEKDRFEKRAPKTLEKQTRKPVKPQQKQEPKEDVVRTITLPEVMTIKELADAMKVQPSVIVKKLFMQGEIVTVNHEIDYEKAEEIALEYNCIAEPEVKVDVIAELLKEDEEAEETMITRAPVVCVMGHVDHGKTSLLDAIRHTRVTDREAGGITQHIGAYMVKCNGQDITFLDTPGHEAFTAMRMRGANSTDIAILVVAADDGVMPQTVEAINHAKAAGIEIIVAINKIDKPSANVDRVKQELSEYELIPEDWGGSTVFVPVSARTKEGIDELLEMILLTAEVLELKSNPNRQARGLVIEAELDKGKGPVATVLVQKGTLHVGDFIAAGACNGKVRAMMDDQGRRVKSAGPSTPVEILGFNGVPHAGEIFVAPETDKEAKAFAETFVAEGKERKLEETKKAKMSLDDLFSQIQAGNVKELNLIVKADVQGSVEAVKSSLMKLSNEEVLVKVIHGGVGAVTESDVNLASASNAIIIGFNVRADVTAKVIAEQEGVDLRFYKVIYSAIEDVEAAMKGMLDPVFEEKVIGHAEVRQLFKASGVGTIAGSYVIDGIFKRGCSVRVMREGNEIYSGPLSSLKRFKDDVKEVRTNFECGLVIEGFSGVQEFDIIEAFEMVEVPR